LSESLGAAYIRIDSIEQAIRTANGSSYEVGDVGYRVGYALARDNLRAGRSVVADSVNPVQESRDGWRSAANESGVGVIEIEVICSDPTEHKQRVEYRDSDIADFSLPTWEEVIAREYHAWDRNRIVIDTAGRSAEQSFTDLLILIAAHLGSA